MNVMILVGDKNNQFFRYLSNTEEIRLFSIYKKGGIFFRIIKKIITRLRIPCSFFYGEWKNDSPPDYVIIEDQAVDDYIFKYLRKLSHGNVKIVYWFRNSMCNTEDSIKRMHLRHAHLCDYVITFDKKDSVEYVFTYIENCYYSFYKNNVEKKEYDMIFMGADKGRYDTLMDIVNYTDKLNWTNYIYIFSNSINEKDGKYIKNKFMDYDEYINVLRKSKIVLDIVSGNQQGYTLRVFEALFYKIKLITNCKDILKEPFYNPNNIYFLATEDSNALNGLSSFIEKEYVDIDDKYLQKYEFYHWVKKVIDLVN